MQDSGTAILNAAAQVRQILIAEAARRAEVPADQLRTEGGSVIAPGGRRYRYGELVAGQRLHVVAASQSALKDPNQYAVMGHPIRRVDIPAKVTGGAAYVQDMRLAGMVHARIVRPPSYGAELVGVATEAVEAMPGVVKVVRDGSFLGVIAEKEFQAIEAMRALTAEAQWREIASLPEAESLPDFLTHLPAQDIRVLEEGNPAAAMVKTTSATYTRPYQAHAAIGPSCAVALFENDTLTIWSHTQGVYPDRAAIAEMLRMPIERVRCIHAEGSGCYGHNGADDAAADAARLARGLPGRPVRLQWMREQEHAWEPFGPAMVVRMSARLDTEGNIVDWRHDVWSNTHSTRPGPAGSLLAARSLAAPFPEPTPKPIPMPEGGGDRNSVPLYKFPRTRVTYHFLPSMPIRVSSMRALGAYANIFAIESFMDELAASGGADPVDYRLRHLDDARARDVVATAAERFNWKGRTHGTPDRGSGFAFARYKNLAAYCAVACEVEVDRESGRVRPLRFVAAVDSGQVVNPNGIANQIEGAILQSISWTLHEQVTFDRHRITSLNWASYPILRFSSVPDTVDVHILNRPGQPFLGTGEAGQGPTAAALANAIADATGQRLRDLPLSPARIKAAMK
jgi:CO/xanthine dehydrogenase Mo-binding subunit